MSSRPFLVGYVWLRALFYSVMCCACMLLAGQAIPGVPDFLVLPSISDQGELVPLRPFSFSSDHKILDPVHMRGKSVRRGPDGWTLEYGTIESRDQLLLADKIQYNPKTKYIEAQGNIRFEGSNFRMYCNRLSMDWDKKSGEATDLKFELPNWIVKSDKAKFETLQKWDFHKVTLSPGLEERPGWKATTSRLKVDLDGYAHFKNLWVWAFGLPTYLFMPYVMFPVNSQQRASGFLPVNLTHGSVGIPYYQVLGKTVDVTVCPRVFAKKGVLWEGELRWSPDQAHKGSVSGKIIKQHTDNQHRRYSFNIKEQWQREDGWRFASDISRASDDLLDFDYDGGVFKLGEGALNSASYLGKSFSWGNVSISAAQQKTYSLMRDPMHCTNYFTALRKSEIMPGIQGTIYPVSLGSFYVDGDIRFDHLGQSLDFGSSLDGVKYDLSRNDIFLRASKSFYLLGPIKTNIRFGGRLTNYSRSLEHTPVAMDNADAFLTKSGSVNRIIGSAKVDFCTPAVSRIFHGDKLSHHLKETKHIVTPYLSFLCNSKPLIEGHLPNFDGVDSCPGISGSVVGEQSVEVGLKQHFLCRSNPNLIFLDLLRSNMSIKYNFCDLSIPGGKPHKGWGSFKHDIGFELGKKFRFNFSQSTNIIGGSLDKAFSIDYRAPSNTWCNLTSFSAKATGLSKSLFVRPKQNGIRLDGGCCFYDDKFRLKLLCNYDFYLKHVTSTQLTFTYDQHCVSESLSFYRVSHDYVSNNCHRKKENRLVFTVSLSNLFNLFKIP